METKIIQIPKQLRNNIPTIHFLSEFNLLIENSSNGILKLNFQKTYFIQPTLIAPLGFLIHLAKTKGNQVILVKICSGLKAFLENYELLEVKDKPEISQIIPFRIFKSTEEVEFKSYLDKSLSKMKNFHELTYVSTYLLECFRILAPTIGCCGYYNLSEDWLFFTIISSRKPELDHPILHLLVHEFQQTGGKLWVAQGDSFYDLKETTTLKLNINKTLLMIGFPLGTL